MKKGIATVLFMILISVAFLTVLATVNEISRDRIVRNQELQFLKSVLYACGLLPEGYNEQVSSSATTDAIPWNDAVIDSLVRNRIQRIRLSVPPELKAIRSAYWGEQDSTDLYLVREEEGRIVSFGFLLRGKGLWGSLSAFSVVHRDFDRMVGIDFIDQSETPGLGARITESAFKIYFRNLSLAGAEDSPVRIEMVGRKEKTNIEESTNSFQAITGATQTCNGVLEMINRELQFYFRLITANPDLRAGG